MAAIWYYFKNGERQGPIEASELKKFAAEGRILPDDLIWKEGMAAWEPARSMKGLFEGYRAAEEDRPRVLPPPPAQVDSRTELPTEPISADVGPRLATKPARSWLAPAAFWLALAAFLLAIVPYFRSSPRGIGHGLGHYDLSSPEAATKARWEMKAQRDLVAREEYRELTEGDAREIVDSLKIKETLEAKELKIVLFSYQRGGKEKHDFWAFAKHPAKNLWVDREITAYELDSTHPEIATKLREWRTKENDPLTAD